jgi:hypothetical protein
MLLSCSGRQMSGVPKQPGARSMIPGCVLGSVVFRTALQVLSTLYRPDRYSLGWRPWVYLFCSRATFRQ